MEQIIHPKSCGFKVQGVLRRFCSENFTVGFAVYLNKYN